MSRYIDLDMDPDARCVSASPATYETIYVTSHKGPCRAGAFSPDGLLIATGSVDASIKILDIERMIMKSTISGGGGGGDNKEHHNEHAHQLQHQNHQDSHPVIRTLYDHSEEVTFLEFHPSEQILASGSKDMTIKFYDYSKTGAKRALKSFQEASPVRCFTFHKTGQYLLVGTEQPTLRLYDTSTCQCYVSCNPLDQHQGPLTSLDYNGNSSFYASASKDGDIRLWDGISNRCVNVLRKAHGGAPVNSVMFSKNGKYLLTSGKDCVVKLWEVSMSECLHSYMVPQATNSKQAIVHRAHAIFNHTEDYVMYPDSKNTRLHVWNSRNAEYLSPLASCHTNTIRHLTHSPTSTSFLTCSEDFRARFWSRKDQLDRDEYFIDQLQTQSANTQSIESTPTDCVELTPQDNTTPTDGVEFTPQHNSTPPDDSGQANEDIKHTIDQRSNQHINNFSSGPIVGESSDVAQSETSPPPSTTPVETSIVVKTEPNN